MNAQAAAPTPSHSETDDAGRLQNARPCAALHETPADQHLEERCRHEQGHLDAEGAVRTNHRGARREQQRARHDADR
jgi:hypothetical protein